MGERVYMNYNELVEMVDIYKGKGAVEVKNGLSEMVSFKILFDKIKTIGLKINIVELNLTAISEQSDKFNLEVDSLMKTSREGLQNIIKEFEDSYLSTVCLLSLNTKHFDENEESDVQDNVETRVKVILSNIFEFTNLRFDDLGLAISMHHSELNKKNDNLSQFIAVMLNDIKKIETDLKEIEEVLDGNIKEIDIGECIEDKNLADRLHVDDVKKVDGNKSKFNFTHEAVVRDNLTMDFVHGGDANNSQSELVLMESFKNENLSDSLNENFVIVREEKNLELADFDNILEIPSEKSNPGSIDGNIADSPEVQNASNIVLNEEQLFGTMEDYESNSVDVRLKENLSNAPLIEPKSSEEHEQFLSFGRNVSRKSNDADGKQTDTEIDSLIMGKLNETIRVDPKNYEEPERNEESEHNYETTGNYIDDTSIKPRDLKKSVEEDSKSWAETLGELVGFGFF